MTPEQVRLVSATWQSVLPIRDTFAELFYRKLFSLDPSLRPLFRGDLKEQGRNLAAMISIIVRNLQRPESVFRALRELGARHKRYGVREEDYATVEAALLWALAMGLNEAFTPEARAAWKRAYGLLSDMMKGAPANAA